ncbi:hypothetical protein [Leisingera sp.]|uniref:hypothetical protein n=1 Tax=Leisingera sp. TaxID=1879318 RepID=UPI002B265EBE|nr:hypothetical protein [Leisingera sp.]
MLDSTFIGLDVHKATISVAIAESVRGGKVRHLGAVPDRPDQLRKLVKSRRPRGHGCISAMKQAPAASPYDVHFERNHPAVKKWWWSILGNMTSS